MKEKDPNAFLQTPKGTLDIMDEQYYQLQGMYEKAQEVAVYYGFKPILTPTLEHIEVFQKGVGEGTDLVDKEMYALKTKGGDHLVMRPEFTAGIMRSYIEHGMHAVPQPILLYAFGPCFRHEKPQRGRLREFRQFDLEILGTEKSIADALIIRTAITILEEFGFKDLTVDINSVGDKESRPKYLKDLVAYFKKHANKLSPEDKERLKTNPLRVLDSKDPAVIALKDGAPNILSYLSTDAKKHFKEVLEYLEEMGVTYRVNPSLVRGLSYYTHTVFEIIKTEKDENGNDREITINGGGRFDYLAKMMGSKKEVPSVGTALGFERIMLFPECKKIAPRILKKPKVYFIQLGFEAKLKSLKIIEILRKAKIPIHQSLSKDSLGSQLALAEKMEIPYTIIFGQKEAMDATVIVRDMHNRSQETIKIEALSDYFKHLKEHQGK